MTLSSIDGCATIPTPKKVAVVMGSDSDFPKVLPAISLLHAWEIPFEVHILSAHRTPQQAAAFAATAQENGFGVLIAAAGMAAHLAGAMAAGTILPVIGIPIRGEHDGTAALLSTVMMPPGIPVATVAENGAKNAALLAAQILALSDARIAALLKKDREEQAAAVAMKDEKMQQILQKDFPQ